MIVEPGTEITPFVVEAVEADHIKALALILRDPNPIHLDREAVAAAGLGDRYVNQGGATLAYVLNMLAAWAGSRAALRRIACRFTANVFEGDRVVAHGVVTAVRSEAGEALADCDVWVERANGERVLTGSATVLL